MTSTARRLSLVGSPKLKVLEFPFIRQGGRRSRLQNWGLVLTSAILLYHEGHEEPEGEKLLIISLCPSYSSWQYTNNIRHTGRR